MYGSTAVDHFSCSQNTATTPLPLTRLQASARPACASNRVDHSIRSTWRYPRTHSMPTATNTSSNRAVRKLSRPLLMSWPRIRDSVPASPLGRTRSGGSATPRGVCAPVARREYARAGRRPWPGTATGISWSARKCISADVPTWTDSAYNVTPSVRRRSLTNVEYGE